VQGEGGAGVGGYEAVECGAVGLVFGEDQGLGGGFGVGVDGEGGEEVA